VPVMEAQSRTWSPNHHAHKGKNDEPRIVWTMTDLCFILGARELEMTPASALECCSIKSETVFHETSLAPVQNYRVCNTKV
jgi:hypothetical protein